MNIINNAYAQSPATADGGMSMLIMVGLFFVIMYFMIIDLKIRGLKSIIN